MRIVLDLSDKDLRYFRDALKRVREGDRAADEALVIEQSRKLITEAIASEPPEFVRFRVAKLELLIRMLEDEEWRLTGEDRARVHNALAYFVDPDDLIPDRVPGLGYLDDAIMVELLVQDLRHEIEAYEHFCQFRKEHRPPPDALEKRRKSLQARMRRRRRRDRDKLRSRGSRTRSPLSLW
jgi:uncharacterized membrane protein YkvA (DUF1232 family)